MVGADWLPEQPQPKMPTLDAELTCLTLVEIGKRTVNAEPHLVRARRGQHLPSPDEIVGKRRGKAVHEKSW